MTGHIMDKENPKILLFIIIKSKIVEKSNRPLNVGNNILFLKLYQQFLKAALRINFFKHIIAALNVSSCIKINLR